MSIVYIPQEIRKMNPRTKQFEAVHDLSPAIAFGKPKVLCSPTMSFSLDPTEMVRSMREGLRDFNDEDYLLAVGDPAAIAIASMLAAAMNNGRVKMLRWDRLVRQYLELQLDVR
jgi:hypothetical protein